jgi:putative transport protein
MLDWFFQLPQTSPVAHALGLIALVCAAGMAIGSIKVKGIGLGSSGVLFVGILVGQLTLPIDRQTLNFVKEFGLVLFVFAMGLQLGSGFFASLRQGGLRLNLLAAVLVIMAGMLTPLFGWMASMEPEALGGLFAGASINVPALGAAQQSLATLPGVSPERLALPALACAVTYPAAIVGSLATLLLLKIIFRINPAQEAEEYAAQRRKPIEPLIRRTLIVEQEAFANLPLDEVCRRIGGNVVVSRIRRSGETDVGAALKGTLVNVGDTILAVGTADALDGFERNIGRRTDEDLIAAPGNLTFRRIALTNSRMLGKQVNEVNLERRFAVEVTRIVRGDMEMTAISGMRLQFGDILHVVGTEEQLRKATTLLGNSLKKLNETQFIPLFAGIFLGVLVGTIPLRFPGLANPLRLGLAGGPLLVALVLGRVGHLGALVWHMPMSANHAFREFGVALFLAALGLAAGDQFFAAVFSSRGLVWLAAGVVINIVPLLSVGIWSRTVEKMNFVTLSGLLAGSTTNPPLLTFANNICGSDAPSLAYATVYPLTTLLRILVAQMLVLFLCG